MDFNKMLGEKAWWELLNAVYYFEQIIDAALYTTAV